MLSTHSRGIQRAAYDVLHRVIPRAQETVSLNEALSGNIAKLPGELISLLLEVPLIGNPLQQPVEENSLIDVRRYLLSWKTVFDHFSGAVSFFFSSNISVD